MREALMIQDQAAYFDGAHTHTAETMLDDNVRALLEKYRSRILHLQEAPATSSIGFGPLFGLIVCIDTGVATYVVTAATLHDARRIRELGRSSRPTGAATSTAPCTT